MKQIALIRLIRKWRMTASHSLLFAAYLMYQQQSKRVRDAALLHQTILLQGSLATLAARRCAQMPLRYDAVGKLRRGYNRVMDVRARMKNAAKKNEIIGSA
ncbi:MAG: hypothetical protein ACRCX9_00440 [Plesiomonas shigelloides]